VKLGLRKKWPRTKKNKTRYGGQQQKEMDCDEPHLKSNEKM